MATDISKLHHNAFGVAFHWKKDIKAKNPKIQLVFRDIGLYLDIDDIDYFLKEVQTSFEKSKNCGCCKNAESLKCILVSTPCSKLDLAVSMQELRLLENLLRGTIYNYKLNAVLKSNGISS